MKLETPKRLKSLRLLSVLFTFIALIGLFSNVLVQPPIWIILIQVIPLPIFLIILTMVNLDLVKKDYVTIKGELVEKKVYTVGILIENGNVKKFRANKEFAKEINELKLHQEIEIQYYRRTKAVIQIKKLIEPQLKNFES
ncbi:hypothetical protein [Paenibacillus endoradicis]|uniref:hypothetical protein n=1 Tax=Paenibacillus endoradicis TaxID=2972487 RepID=UPI002158B50F|nr:hypothetical protein [Paenibacillus endoradicis]MCR8656707.1 hypothetical protein [Paenibacillus endoradicis]